jgi:pimeloyl-ACP methyl ester carboxylesterase
MQHRTSPPFADTRAAVRDISAAVDFILAQHGVKQLTLIGWSWGTSTTASFAAQHPDKTARLVLVSPMWLGLNPPPFKGAYRTSTHDSARAFAIAGMPKDRVDEIAPLASFDRWWAATLATDPQGAQASPPVVRSPNGVLQDFQQIWAAGHATYDPAQIQAPTLLVVGEWDAITPPSMAQQLYGNPAKERACATVRGTFHCHPKHRLRLMREAEFSRGAIRAGEHHAATGGRCECCNTDSPAIPTRPILLLRMHFLRALYQWVL